MKDRRHWLDGGIFGLLLLGLLGLVGAVGQIAGQLWLPGFADLFVGIASIVAALEAMRVRLAATWASEPR